MAAININKEQFLNLIREDKPVLVDFWAPWCGYCRKTEPVYEKVAEEYGEDIVIAKVNIDEEPSLAQQERIEVIPTLVLYRQGRSVSSIVAPESKERIDAFINASLEK